MRQLQNTLYVTTPDAYLRLEGETLCVMVEKEKRLQVPMHHLGSIVCFGDVMLSPALLGRCMQKGRSVVWLERGGRFQARVKGPVRGNILLRRAQYRAADDPAKTIELARAFLAGKLRNSRNVLARGVRDGQNETERAVLVQNARLVAGHLRKLPHTWADCAARKAMQLASISSPCNTSSARPFVAILPSMHAVGGRQPIP